MRLPLVLTWLIILCLNCRVSAQIFGWDQLGAGVHGGTTDPTVNCLLEWDSGTGVVLVAGGDFSIPAVGAVNIATWDGSAWSPLGSGFDGPVNAVVSFDDGSGPALYAAGRFQNAGGIAASNIARWDGTAWSALPIEIEGSVDSLAVYDDGSGNALYVGGSIRWPGNAALQGIAMWDGSGWSQVGMGIPAAPLILGAPGALALLVFDDGSGPALYMGGNMQGYGLVARWDGNALSAVGSGIPGGGIFGQTAAIYSMAIFDHGSGPSLVVAGRFPTAGGSPASNLARWTGTTWLPMGGGVGSFADRVLALAVYDDGGGERLYAGGEFLLSPGSTPIVNLARWDGSSWVSGSGATDRPILSMATATIGGTSDLYLGGEFTALNGAPRNRVARFDGAAWSPLDGIESQFMSPSVEDMVVFNDGNGSSLYALGSFASAGAASVQHVAKWGGSGWSSLGNGLGGVAHTAQVFNDGAGDALYVGGRFETAGSSSANSIAKWDGSTWSPLGSGMNGAVLSLAIFDDGTGAALYAGGEFTMADGIVVNGIAKWDGAAWSPLGLGLSSLTEARVEALYVWDDGSGPALYAGGSFTGAGAVLAASVAKWNGTTWSPLGSGLDGPSINCKTVFDLQAYDEGAGPMLFACGQFTTAGGITVQNIARWDGSNWSPVGGATGMSPHCEVYGLKDLEVYDDGRGPALFACGAVHQGHSLVRWNGAGWWLVNPTPGSNPGTLFWQSLAVFDDGSGATLYAGGQFTDINGVAIKHIARSICSWTNSINITQSEWPASQVWIQHCNLNPGHEYFNFFSVVPCAAGAGSGAPGLLGLCGDPAFLFSQAALPLGTPPSHFIATSSYMSFGPYPPFMPPVTIEAVNVDVTGGVIGSISAVQRILITAQ